MVLYSTHDHSNADILQGTENSPIHRRNQSFCRRFLFYLGEPIILDGIFSSSGPHLVILDDRALRRLPSHDFAEIYIFIAGMACEVSIWFIIHQASGLRYGQT